MILLFLLSMLLSVSRAQTSSTPPPSALRQSGDVLQAILPAAAFASQLIEKDWKGLRQFAFSVGVASATTFGLKHAVAKTRPDALDRRSFPSGHSMFSFTGASFLATKYGPKVGLPAFAVAGFVGFTRIHTNRHYADDVVAGAGIGIISNFLFAPPEREGAGRYHAEFEYAAFYPHRFDTTIPGLPGVAFLPGAENRNRAATARVKLHWQDSGRNQYGVFWAPLEVLGSAKGGEGARPLDFHELGLRYRRALWDTPRATLRAGITVSGRETRITGAPLAAPAIDREIIPLLHGQLEWRFRPAFSLLAESDAMRWTRGQYSAAASAALRWRPKPLWNLDLGYRSFSRVRYSDHLDNRLRFGYILIGIGRTF